MFNVGDRVVVSNDMFTPSFANKHGVVIETLEVGCIVLIDGDNHQNLGFFNDELSLEDSNVQAG